MIKTIKFKYIYDSKKLDKLFLNFNNMSLSEHLHRLTISQDSIVVTS